MKPHSAFSCIVVALLLAAAGAAVAGGGAGEAGARTDVDAGTTLEVSPRRLTLEVGGTRNLGAIVRDSRGRPVELQVVFYSRARQSLTVSATGRLTALRPGRHTVVAMVAGRQAIARDGHAGRIQAEVIVDVPMPPVARLKLDRLSEELYEGTSLALDVEVLDRSGIRRHDLALSYTSSDESVASVDELGLLTLRKVGTAVIGAAVSDASIERSVRVVENPVVRLKLESDRDHAVTGEVVRFSARGLDERGRAVEGLPIRFTVTGRVDPDIIAPGATATVDEDGFFIAERSGVYTVVASAGGRSVSKTLSVEPRAGARRFEVVGRGPVRDRHTSDLWVWRDSADRDWAIAGTWGAGGEAHIWDVDDPARPRLVQTVKVDARTVNDVKVSADGRLAVISREGASNRKNGIVVLDVSDPAAGVEVLSAYNDQLTGGVHNLFLYGRHAYVINNSRRFDVIDLEDPRNPFRVGRFTLDTPGNAIHDIWILDGVAFTSNWKDGVVAIDVGGGGEGGSPSHPVELGRYAYPNGWNHAAFPYRSPSTGKFYVFAGDEAFPYSKLRTQKTAQPNRAAGWIHVIEWDEWHSPREVARYQVPEAGSHNFWVEDDILYAAFYNGGLRAVDVSGELRGDLYRQGREIAFWLPQDPQGYVANAAFTWGVQPHAGNLFVSDWNSGLWVVRLVDDEPRVIGEPR